MVKHAAKKPRKKREQPWTKAARDRLRPSTRAAFLKFATPLIFPIANASEAQFVLEAARFAWNLPLLYALSTEPESAGAMIREDAEPWLANFSEFLPLLGPLVMRRTQEFDSFREPIVEALAVWKGDGRVELEITLGDDVGNAPWSRALPPLDAATSLSIVAGPVLALLPNTFADDETWREAANEAIALAVFAWNQPALDQPRSELSEGFRELTAEGTRRARELPAPGPAIFESMCEIRRTRFGYDTRTVSAAVVLENGKAQLWVTAPGEGCFGPGADKPSIENQLKEDWFPRLRALFGAAIDRAS